MLSSIGECLMFGWECEYNASNRDEPFTYTPELYFEALRRERLAREEMRNAPCRNPIMNSDDHRKPR